MKTVSARRRKVTLVILLALLIVAGWKGSAAYAEYRAFQSARDSFLSGEAYLDHGRIYEAEQEFRKSVTAYPYLYASWDAIYTIYYLQGDYDRAAAVLVEALEKLPREPRIHRDLGQVFHKLGRHSEEREALESAMKLDPTDPMPGRLLQVCQRTSKN